MAGWFRVSCVQKHCGSGSDFDASARLAVQEMPKANKDHRRNRYAGQPYVFADLVLGGYLVTSMTPGMSATQFQRQLGLARYETAFQILHKLRAGMVRPDIDPIGGAHAVEMDETWIGGRTRGEGRGVHHKTCVVGAVEVRQGKKKTKKKKLGEQSKAIPDQGETYAGRLRLRVVPNRSAESLVGFARDVVAPESRITTDDWSGYDTLCLYDFNHAAVAERGNPSVAEEWLPMIHLVFSNLKSWLLGTYHGVSPQHLQAYLNEFAFRFNRRFYPFNAFRSLLGISAGTLSPTYAKLYSGRYEHCRPGMKTAVTTSSR
jgi:transposase-like protein